jgi:stage II sporulation protein M
VLFICRNKRHININIIVNLFFVCDSYNAGRAGLNGGDKLTFNKKIPGLKDFLDYVYDLRWYILVIVTIFVAFAAIGYGVAVMSPEYTDQTISEVKDQVGPLKETSALGLMLGIFENNVIKCFLVVVLGLAVGIAPLLFTVANGIVIGIVIGATIGKTGLLYVLVGILPHGIIEMPMVFISAAIGLKLGYDVLRALVQKKVPIWKDIKEGLLIFVFWVAPLLLVAAFMETFVTGTLLYLLFAH